MNRLRLTELTMAGPGVSPASVRFNGQLTVIYGASETGKTFIARVLDFMLGASKLTLIPEADGYTDIYLAVEQTEADPWTLGRKVGGSPFLRWSGLSPIPPTGEPIKMAVKHTADTSASRFWLERAGLAGEKVLRKVNGESRDLSIRDLAHLCLIDETDIQAVRSPVLGEQATGRTASKAVFRLLVEGKADPDAARDVPSAEKRTASAGKADLLSMLIRELEDDPAGHATLENLEERLELVADSIHETGRALEDAAGQRNALIRSSAALQLQASELEQVMSETDELHQRFQLLAAKYKSDLDRLSMIHEAGSLLGYLFRGPCPFCGTALEDQPEADAHLEAEATDLAASIEAERSATQSLLDDLQITIQGVVERRAQVSTALDANAKDRAQAVRRVAELDRQLEPASTDLAALLDTRSALERGIAIKARIEEYEELRSEFTEATSPTDTSGSLRQTSEGIAQFCRTVESLLRRWQVPGVDAVRLDLADYEIIVGDQARAARGKGMRSIIHAAFTVGLAVHCIENDLRHPGFVVLDSPLVTYRGPASDRTRAAIADEALPQSAAEAFFSYLASDFPGQAIVLENDPPPPTLVSGITATQFTKSGHGRYGFIPI